MKRAALILALLVVAASAAAGALWKLDQQRRTKYTDGGSIVRGADEVFVRKVLWTPPVRLGGSVNTTRDELEPHVSADGTTLLLARGGYGTRSTLHIAGRKEGGGDALGWLAPMPLHEVNSEHHDRAPSLSADGRILLLASDRPGGLGGMDLWIAHRSTDGWSRPENLGPVINSEHNEVGAALSPDRLTLVFASDRAGGGYDLYVARLTPEGWNNPAPAAALNSRGDDCAPAFSPAGDFLYFASNREGGRGGYDLYRARLLNGEFLPPESLGDEINTAADERDPAPESGGFALVFASSRQAEGAEAGLDLWRAESREVFVRVEPRGPIDLASLMALLGPLLLWLLLMLAALLLAMLSWKGVRSNRLSLLARCLLASLIAHLMLMILLTFWQVTTQIAHMMDRGGTRVALTTSASVDALSQQMRGGMTDVAVPAAQPTDSAARAVSDIPQYAPSMKQAEVATRRTELPVEQRDALAVRAVDSQVQAMLPVIESSTPEMDAMPSQAQHDLATPADQQQQAVAEARASQPNQQAVESVRTMLEHQPENLSVAAPAIAPTAMTMDAPDALPVRAQARDARIVEPAPAVAILTPGDAVRIDALAERSVDLPRPAQGEFARADEPDGPAIPTSAPQAEASRIEIITAGTAHQQPVNVAAVAPSKSAIDNPAPMQMATAHAAESTPYSHVSAEMPPMMLALDESMLGNAVDVHALPQEMAETTAVAHEPGQPVIVAERDASADRAPFVAHQQATAHAPAFARTAAVLGAHLDTEPITHTADVAAMDSPGPDVTVHAPSATHIDIDDDRQRDARPPALEVPTELAAAHVQSNDRAEQAAATDAQLDAPQSVVLDVMVKREDAAPVNVMQQIDSAAIDPAARAAIDPEALDTARMARAISDAEGGVEVLASPAAAPARDALLDDLDMMPGAAAFAAAMPEDALSTLSRGPSAVDSNEEYPPQIHARDAPLSVRAAANLSHSMAVDAQMIDASTVMAGAWTSDVADTLLSIDMPQPAESLMVAEVTAAALPAALGMSELAATTPRAGAAADINFRLPMEMSAPANPYAARAEATRLDTVKRMGGSEETERAVEMALAWLARHQSADGRWGTRAFDVDCNGCGGQGKFDTDIATTGLALLCFLGADHTHLKDGPYRAHVVRGLQWLVEQQKPDGDLRGGETMYSHGIAAIVLAEAYGMTADARLREPVRRAVAFIDAARNTSTAPGGGGWRYEPGQAGDTSVAGWQVMALMSARRAGLETPDASFAAASAWMETVGVPNRPGRYAYQPGQPPSPSMTAEGLFIQQLLGVPRDDPRMLGSVAYIMENLPRWDDAASTYYWYYATLAMFQHGGPEWDRWNRELTRVLLANQRRSGPSAGSWDPRDNWAQIGGRVYQTALCTLSLEVYYRYLPMYRAATLAGSPSAVRGMVTDAMTGLPLVGATVKIDLSTGAGALIAATDAEGRYALALPELPAEFVAMSASMNGYVPATTNIERREAQATGVTRDFALQRERSNIIALEDDPQVHHLGNDAFEGTINSQFQKRTQGSTYRATFTLGREHLPPNVRSATIVMMVKGAQAQNTIFVNDQRLRERLNGSPADGSFGEFRAEIPLALLRLGENVITIRASTSMGDLDDFEFTNIQVHFDGDES